MLSFFLFISSLVWSFDYKINHNSLILRTGFSVPVFGHFGDKDAGFKPNFSYSFSYLRDYDELISFGFITGENFYFKNKKSDIKIKFFSLTPSVFIKPTNDSLEYVYAGAGLYHWSSPENSLFTSTSDDEFGFVAGYNKFLNSSEFKIGLGFEWNHVVGVKGRYFDLGNINIVVLYLSLRYDF